MGMFMALALFAAAGNAVILEPVACLHSRAGEDADVVSQAIYEIGRASWRERV